MNERSTGDSVPALQMDAPIERKPPSRGVLPRIADLPGRAIQRLAGAPRLPIDAQDPIDGDVAEIAAVSARANGYLSVNPALHVWRGNVGLVAYAISGRTAFVVGGVHARGDRRDETTTLRDFREAFRAAGGRRVLLFPVLSAGRDAAARAGFSCVQTGVEAFIDLETYTLRGKAYADLRQMRNRATKRHQLEVVELDPRKDRHRMLAVYKAWLQAQPVRHRMSLVVGGPELDAPRGRRYFGAENADASLQAFASFVPCFDGRGYGVDVMARAPGSAAGAMELTLSQAGVLLRDQGTEVYSIGACPMATGPDGPNDERRPPLLGWIFDTLYTSDFGNRLFNFRSLHTFKSKFAPRWEPVYFAAWPRVSIPALYIGCGMWGLFGEPWRSEPRMHKSLGARR